MFCQGENKTPSVLLSSSWGFRVCEEGRGLGMWHKPGQGCELGGEGHRWRAQARSHAQEAGRPGQVHGCPSKTEDSAHLGELHTATGQLCKLALAGFATCLSQRRCSLPAFHDDWFRLLRPEPISMRCSLGHRHWSNTVQSARSWRFFSLIEKLLCLFALSAAVCV